MTPNVVTLVQGALGPEVLAQAGERLGEDPSALARAAGAAVPAVLWRVIERGRAAGGAEALLTAMRETGAARALADPLARLQPDGRPDAALLGDDITDVLADFSRISESSASALLAMLTPLALGAFARITPTPLNPDTLSRALREQENNVERAFPPGFDLRGTAAPILADAPAMSSHEPAEREPEPTASFAPPEPAPVVQPPATVTASSGGLPKWLLPLVAVLILLVVALVLMRSLGGGNDPEPQAPPAEVVTPAPSAPPG